MKGGISIGSSLMNSFRSPSQQRHCAFQSVFARENVKRRFRGFGEGRHFGAVFQQEVDDLLGVGPVEGAGAMLAVFSLERKESEIPAQMR